MSSLEKLRKENRRSRRGNRKAKESKKIYDPPSPATTKESKNFVTEPPEQGGLTTGISTLFRRERTELSSDSSPITRSQSNNVDKSVEESTLESSRILSNEDTDDGTYDDSRLTSHYTKHEDGSDFTRVRRYRGFSTSIQSLFLDESLVCASIGCFGLLLSQRTEFLLNVRNRQKAKEKRLGTKSAYRSPSRIIIYAFFATIALMGCSYVIWGFGDVASLQTYESGNNDDWQSSYQGDDNEDEYDDDSYKQGDDNNNKNNVDDGNNGDDDYNNYNNNDNDDDDGNAYNGNNDDDGYYYNNNNANYYNGYDDDVYYYNNYANPYSERKGDDEYSYNNDLDHYNGNTEDDGYYYNTNGKNHRNYYQDHANDNKKKTANDDQYKTDGYFQVADDENDDYFADDDVNGNRRLIRHYKPYGTMIRDYQDVFWNPFLEFLQEEWNYSEERKLESDENDQDWGNNVRLILFMVFLLVLGVIGRRRRMRTRWALARARAQEDEFYYGKSHKKKNKSLEDHYEIACAHTMCGCYPADLAIDGKYEAEEATEYGMRQKHADCFSKFFSCIMGTCCGCICKCWIQFMSICALAQEAREVKLLVPPKFQRIDLLTHQPFSEYQPAINELRRAWLGKARRKAGLMPHLQALSRLSRQILITAIFLTLVIGCTLLFNPHALFSVQDSIVLSVTFLQSFFLLYIFHWVYHKSDLSVDAVIKCFAAGFVIAAPAAFVFEGLLVNMILGLSYSTWSVIARIKNGQRVLNWIVAHYRHFWIGGELANAFIVTSITEEFCKYYSFRAIEHPDLIFLTSLNRPIHGGVKKLNETDSFGSGTSDESSLSEKSETQKWIEKTKTEEEFFEDDTDVRSYRKKAAAVTTAMISVAVGLACAENFLYIFLLGGRSTADLKEEWTVLLLRSVFPVHALSAALQSINMIQKFVENAPDSQKHHQIGVGRIVLPAVILHGLFDAIILGINIYTEISTEDYLTKNSGNIEDGAEMYDSTLVKAVAWGGVTLIMILGSVWYYLHHRKQSRRLRGMEQADFRVHTRGKYSPTRSAHSELSVV